MTIVHGDDAKAVNQEIYRWLDSMARKGWRKTGTDGAITYLERRPRGRHHGRD